MPPEPGELLRLVASGRPGPWWLGGLRAACRVASLAYGLGAGLDRLAYERGWRERGSLPALVIGVGNLAVGGTGKTPLVIEIVRRLGRLGRRAAVMSRGYGGEAQDGVTWVWRDGQVLADVRQSGDEPMLLARRLAAPLAVGRDRLAVGRALLAHCPEAVLVADDLFQHHRLRRDLDIVALDAADPLGGGALVPRGLLREPPSALARAGALILTRATDERQVSRAERLLRPYNAQAPLLSCGYRVDSLAGPDGQTVAAQSLQCRKVAAFCGLARPQSFRHTLEALGLEVARFSVFGDHHFFTPAQIEDLWRAAQAVGAEALVCTEKDRVRLGVPPPSGPPLYNTVLELDFGADSARLDQLLRQKLQEWTAAT